MKRKSKTFALSSAVLMLMLAGCGVGNPPEGAAGGEASPAPVASPVVSASAAPAPAPSAEPSVAPTAAPAPEQAEHRKYGIYNGAADPHTVEIESDGQPQAYQLAEGVSTEGIAEGGEVFFIYKEQPVEGDASVKQLILAKLAKAKTFKLSVQTAPAEKPAALMQGKGFGLYVFSALDFDPEKGILSFGDPAQGNKLQASIQPYGSDYRTDDLKAEARKEFAGIELADVPQDKRPVPLRDAAVFLEGSNDSDMVQYIAKKYDGEWFVFKVDTNKTEDGGIFSDYVYTSLNSLERSRNPN
ncbi:MULTISPECIES: hypothetical protein [unclassified Paenibacillus]|uniref:hypothetical protein n=1 Tax=unclassified Paenibacillus TaxID=185978 RepID=UPI000955735C|nr:MULTISPECIES: hypothetical protein [unclassified Paenibacillus]ASS68395.1 hypothetical protein CIC07_21360 [Paenibacillus sp. RUD330]SIR31867.1 hypothetical protein SAMN05880555_3458 [Paenibacillus sp. RU4X]SIR43202.1 hypothetical protein SAMN05880570_3459 [Paenibacillus sp. RU4T]